MMHHTQSLRRTAVAKGGDWSLCTVHKSTVEAPYSMTQQYQTSVSNMSIIQQSVSHSSVIQQYHTAEVNIRIIQQYISAYQR